MPNQDSLTYTKTNYLRSAATLSQCPGEITREVAFAGRSNAGKSSALNRLTGQKKLARTSKTPGRTQLINYFQLGELPLALVDLPGYGYAKVPIGVKNAWQKELGNYLQKREALVGLVLLMDIRHPLTDYDQRMLEWANDNGMPLHLVLTKSDKLKRGAAKSTLLKVQQAVRDSSTDVSVQMFSSLNGDGLEELKRRLNQWFLPPGDTVGADPEDDIDPGITDLPAAAQNDSDSGDD
ncbi:ribosome biogenesis GTP-binding protein YihA/YsxC [Oceanobacter sp. 4_MG-2023]|uniref:ribosome biogenesis GTP-binding protein YihA/YsxC n=1 Tax=Oceanobacter sp. 4_MG-2023 TaxID=3062623 RepID=UPI002733BE7B|nr:ribosome biogenesis GTP-binding protein YihA/YsxC [Oceanobacter sp. 4_MG-2023]MDP2547074.1 ribosome biogenesis GTP-binding protein YihA/YsxC [Oceanobacter sp. 4_MG-2023]